MITRPPEPQNREEARARLRDAELTIKKCRHRGVNTLPHEKAARELRNRWMFF